VASPFLHGFKLDYAPGNAGDWILVPLFSFLDAHFSEGILLEKEDGKPRAND